MAIVRFFENRPVKRMALVPEGIKLIFYGPIPGAPGVQRIVSQADWDRNGEKRTVPADQATAAALRELAASPRP